MDWVKSEKLRYFLLIIAVVGFLISGFYEFKSEWSKYHPKISRVTKVEQEKKQEPKEQIPTTEETEVAEIEAEENLLPVAHNLEEVQGEIPEGFYANTLFIGDSRTVGLMEYGNIPGATFFADEGMSVYKMEEFTQSYEGLGQVTLEGLLSNRKFERIFFMIGINELGYNQETTMEKFQTWVEKIQALQPEAQLVICGNLHVTQERSSQDAIFNNANIDGLNQRMKEIAESKGLKYIDVNSIFDDETGSLSVQYSNDDTHPVGKYYATWARWLANYQSYEK